MDGESLDFQTQQIFDLHIKILEKIFLQVTFDEIINLYKKKMSNTNYLEVIKKSGHLSFDVNGVLIGAYPVSPSPTDYIIHLGGVGMGYSMCAIDALGLAYTFMKKTTIETIDKSNGNKLLIAIDPESDTHKKHDLYVTYQNTPDELQGDESAAKVQCPNIHFYSSKKDIPDDLHIWDYSDALQYSRNRFGRREMSKRIQITIDSFHVDN